MSLAVNDQNGGEVEVGTAGGDRLVNGVEVELKVGTVYGERLTLVGRGAGSEGGTARVNGTGDGIASGNGLTLS